MEVLKLKINERIPKNYTGIAEYSNGDKYWYKEGKYHRFDGPAIECYDGGKESFKEGEYHRTDGPAIERVNGTKEWWIEDKSYSNFKLGIFVEELIFLGKEKGKYDLDWLKFLTEKRIAEFAVIPGMENDLSFKKVFAYLGI